MLTDPLVGSLASTFNEGIVETVVYQGKEWRIRFEATSWPAKSKKLVTLNVGDFVRVIGRENITLYIEPV